MIETINLLDTNIHNVSYREAIDITEKLIIDNTKYHSIVTPNVDHLIKLRKDEEFQEVYRDASLILADGMPLMWAAKYLGTPLKAKVSGSDFFPDFCKVASKKGYKLFFMGGREGAADAAAEILKKRHAGLNIVGTYCPPFGFEKDQQENKKIIEMVKQARPDVLFVGLGAPKQEKWIFRHKDKYQVPVSIGIGVSFEFVSGMVKRAPVIFQKAGLEWFWRLSVEPKRLWRRYIIEDSKFFKLVVQQKRVMKKT